MNNSGLAARCITVLFAMASFELFVGGGGRLVTIGPVTLRMLLFACMLLVIAATMLTRPDKRGDFGFAIMLVLVYFGIHVPAAVVGMLAGASIVDVFGDLQPTLYWAAAPFFALAMSDLGNIERARKLVILAGSALALSYLCTLAALAAGLIDPIDLWLALAETGEFFFRNDYQFFYKGHLYLGIAIVFLLAMPRRRPWLLILILSALILTLTRGFILALGLTAMLMFLLKGRWKWLVSMLIFLVVLVLAAANIGRSAGDEALGARGDADAQRLGDLRYMAEEVTPRTLLIGEGFGTLINERMNIETSYLWIVWKAGLPSLIFWLAPLAICQGAFARIRRRSRSQPLATAYMFGVIFVYVQTATNPYLNNPIGLSFVLIAMFALRRLAREERAARPNPPARLPEAVARPAGGP